MRQKKRRQNISTCARELKKSARMDKRQWVNSRRDEIKKKHAGKAKTRQAYCAIKQLRGKFET